MKKLQSILLYQMFSTQGQMCWDLKVKEESTRLKS